MRRSKYLVPIAAAATLVLATTGPASAVVSVSGTSVNSDAAGDVITVSCGAGVLSAAGTVSTGSACATMTSLTVNPGGGNDTVNLSGVTAAGFPALLQVTVNANEGFADTITGSPLVDAIDASSTDTVNAGDGADKLFGGGVVTGGNGDDTFYEQATGPVSGGPGDDRFVGSLAGNGLDGDEGWDSWILDLDELLPPIGVDTVWTMSPTGLVLSLPSDPTPLETLPASDIEEVEFTLLRRALQIYDGTTYAGASTVWGLAGVDDLRGGPAGDALHAGSENDTVTGNGGSDRLFGGDGDDTIQARDGVVDTIDCGNGNDTAVVDAADLVTGCETVQLPPAPPAPAPTEPTTGKVKGPDSVTKPAKAKFKFSSPTAGATFQCKLDKKAWKSCSSPHKVKTKKLDVGKHKLQVRAVLNGVVDATPSKAKFKVKAG